LTISKYQFKIETKRESCGLRSKNSGPDRLQLGPVGRSRTNILPRTGPNNAGAPGPSLRSSVRSIYLYVTGLKNILSYSTSLILVCVQSASAVGLQSLRENSFHAIWHSYTANCYSYKHIVQVSVFLTVRQPQVGR